MVTAVFLCDKEWKIQDVMQYDAKFPILPGEFLTALVAQPEKLMQDAGEHRTLLLGFPDFGMQLSVTIRLFQEGNLVFLAHFVNDEEYIEFAALYEKGLEWAKNHLQGLYHSEYYQISQLNNQLVDSKRALTRANRKLKQAVQEIEKTNERLVEAEKAAEHAMHVAEQANRLKTEFLANMSHDIRTPMNAIVGLSNLMEKDVEKPDKIMNYIEKLQVTSQHLLGLLNDVLDLSKIENGSVSLRMESVNLAAQLRQIEAVTRPQAKARNQTFRIRARGIRHEDFFSDATRLRQVLLNLLSNAVKYTQEGGEILFEMEEFANPDGDLYYRFVVEDNGMGMSEEYLKHIFDPFSRSEESLATEIQGTGLGMSITKNIVDLMNGSITVESELGKGTEFVVTVDFKLAENAVHYMPIRELQGARALVVDDDVNTCQSVSKMLRSIEMHPDWSTSGREAVIRAKEAEEIKDGYKAYIIDYLMPDMNGIETVRQIRKVIGDEVPIIVLTAYEWSEFEDEAREAGVTAFVSKPIFMSELREVLTRQSMDVAEIEKVPQPKCDYSGKRVLLVEDNDLNREIATIILEDTGIVVDTAEDGIEAINIMNHAWEDQYDLIFMDIQMPKMDGYTATREIRTLKNNKKANIPIVAMTANAFDEDRRKSFEAGMNGHIAKPLDMAALTMTLNRIFGMK